MEKTEKNHERKEKKLKSQEKLTIIMLGLGIVAVIVSIIQIIRYMISVGFWHTLLWFFITGLLGGGIIGIVKVFIIGETQFQKNKEIITTIGTAIGIIVFVVLITLEIGWIR